MWRKAPLVVLWVVGMTLIVLRFGDRYEERSVQTGRLLVEVLPGAGEGDVPAFLQMEVEAAIADGGDRVHLLFEAGDVKRSNPSGPELELILDGDDVYFHAVGRRPRLPRGATWIRLEADEASDVIPGIEGVLRLVDAEKLLTTAPEPDADPSGHETIDGVETARYERAAALDELDDAVGLSGETFEQMRAATGEDVELTIWQDEDGFVRRFTLPVSSSFLAPRRGGDDLIVLQYTMTDLGEEITVELPDEDETVTL